MYFIRKGFVNVLSADETSKLATLKEGDYFGEIVLKKKFARTKSVNAIDYCYLYTLGKKNFDTFLKKIQNLDLIYKIQLKKEKNKRLFKKN